MELKIVIKVSMNDDTSLKKAMMIAVGCSGFESSAFKGPGKDQIVVIGDGIDAVELAIKLRKKVGFAEIVSVGPAIVSVGPASSSSVKKVQFGAVFIYSYSYSSSDSDSDPEIESVRAEIVSPSSP